MGKVKLSVVILNYNTKELLKQCLRSVGVAVRDMRDMRGLGGGSQTIVVDNDSSDGSAEMVKKEFPKIQLIKSKKNLGFSKGNNLARKVIGGEYVLFLNPDTIIEKKVFQKTVKFMDDNPKVGITTCFVVLPDGDLYYACHRGFPTPWNSFCYFSGLAKLFPRKKIFSGYTASYLPMGKIHEIEACSGTFLLTRKKILDKVGWLDEDYYWCGEDLDLCYKVKQLGYKIMFNPEAKIIHYWGAASGLKESSQEISTASVETKKMMTKARFEAMEIFYRKHYQKTYPVWLTKLILLAIEIKKQIALLSL